MVEFLEIFEFPLRGGGAGAFPELNSRQRFFDIIENARLRGRIKVVNGEVLEEEFFTVETAQATGR